MPVFVQTLDSGLPHVGNVNILAFAVALLAAPWVVAMLTFWAYLIPVFAAFIGWLPYLVFGGPALFLYLLVFPPAPLLTAILLYWINRLAFDAAFDLARHLGMRITPDTAELNFMFGSLFAPLWGVAFGAIYMLIDRRT